MKKSVVLAAFGLSLAVLTGCGAPKAEDLLKGMQEYEMDSAEYSAYCDFAMTVKADEKIKVNVSADLSGEFSGAAEDDVLAHVNASYSYDIMGEKDKGDLEAFIDQGKKDYTVYFENPDDEEWYSITLDEDTLDTLGVEVDLTAAMDDKLVGKLNDATVESLAEIATVEKGLQDIEGIKCYVLTAEGTYADLKPVIEVLLKENDDFADVLDEADIDTKDFYKMMEYIPFNVTYYIAKDGGYMVACDMVIGEIDFEGMLDVVDLELDDLGVDSISIDTFAIGVTYTGVNETEVELSKDAKKAEDLSDMLSLLFMDDYGYDYDYDDDYAVEVEPDDDYTYDTSTWTCDIYDYYGSYITTAWAPGLYTYDASSSNFDEYNDEYHWFTLSDGYGDYIYINTWAGEVATPLDDYLKGYYVASDYPDYTNYTADMELLDYTINGWDAYFVEESYTYGGEKYTSQYIVAPYNDSMGVDEYLTLEFTESLTYDDANSYVYSMF